jgi:hypothetical protein
MRGIVEEEGSVAAYFKVLSSQSRSVTPTLTCSVVRNIRSGRKMKGNKTKKEYDIRSE